MRVSKNLEIYILKKVQRDQTQFYLFIVFFKEGSTSTKEPIKGKRKENFNVANKKNKKRKRKRKY